MFLMRMAVADGQRPQTADMFSLKRDADKKGVKEEAGDAAPKPDMGRRAGELGLKQGLSCCTLLTSVSICVAHIHSTFRKKVASFFFFLFFGSFIQMYAVFLCDYSDIPLAVRHTFFFFLQQIMR